MTIQTYLTNLCKHSGLEQELVSIDVQEDETYVQVQLTVPVEDSGLFIGYHGETLSSIQRLLRVIFQKDFGDKKIVINVNDYREQRESKLKDIATQVAHRVMETGQQYRFSYLPPHERFTIHTFISENEEFSSLESVSEGEGNHRFLIIRPKQ